ncbi:PHP family phosphohydrolase, histidinol phosphatase [Candidatus Methanoperedens nitroreducens]|uniref:PHP family phosphohydrolase, histidinol phosphatase n=1 Tax=Candidatus Methanoperedens nitratireducens TaxID=1392998 RepID=A0A062V430_9EURY|nr:histidinol phosphate phosphatase domain-containing protein [Candidatus Methanoperedens nitroreducens]KCZ71358.1 PHP family phosphohydrolase, histidinol phosphatase [Candidatus Methanoperedens nitroreducens]MDJ1420987.1 histidinol phosphate phosphatase domain-containing protein [Candidatus Methanoperedens sp.]
MIDLHTHSIFSDGELLPSELVRRAVMQGYTAIAITDHADFTNIEHILSCMSNIKLMEEDYNIRVFTGVELTHVPPRRLPTLVKRARDLGAEIVVVHGETTVEPVPPGTNHAAVTLDVDILAHPGFITVEDAELARENDVYLEITSRNGHNRTNGHVVRIAEKAGSGLVVNTDSHSPHDLITDELALKIAMGAGLDEKGARDATLSQPLSLIRAI